MFDILVETLKLGNVLRDGGSLAKLTEFSFGRDNQVGVAVRVVTRPAEGRGPGPGPGRPTEL